jgi:hypothetical protein
MRRKLAENFKKVRGQIEQACERSGRNPEDVRLIAVTKTVEMDVIRAVVESGHLDIGESRVQNLVKRAGMLQEHLTRRKQLQEPNSPDSPRWHMVGHLQRNKVKQVLPWTRMIHSVDSLRLAEEISKEAGKLDKSVPVLIEVNVANEKAKYGIAVGAANHFAGHISNLTGIEVVGLMAMAPLVGNPEEVRPYFARLREVFEDMKLEGVVGPGFRELSMGMTNDFEVAIEEGATMVRVGRALFEGLGSDD